MPIASIVFLVETTPRARARFAFRGLFYGLRNFRCKTAHFCATRRESETTETPSVSNAAQASENAHKNSVLNYTGKEQNEIKNIVFYVLAEHRRTTCCTNCIRCVAFVGQLLWQL